MNARPRQTASCFVAWLAAVSLGTVWLGVAGQPLAADWPTYQHDPARSGVTDERLALPLAEAWKHVPRHAPQPAWPGPAKDDLYNKALSLRPRMVFDRAFHVAAAGDAVYYGSSADDQVYCLDAATGDVRWSCFTEAPVRFAPTVVHDRVYVGSDDGHVYCLRARDGSQLWRYDSPDQDLRLAGNGRVISLWAVRSGVVVLDDIAYFASGLFPKEGVHLNAVQATDGKLLWRTRIADRPAQGYLLASATRLYVPTGRENPLVFERSTGKLLQALSGAGGTYALLAGDTLLFGPGKTGEIELVEPGQKDRLVTLAGNHVLAARGRFYLQAADQLRVLDQPKYLELIRQRNPLEARRQEILKRIEQLGRNSASPDGIKLAGELGRVQAAIAEVNRQINERCVPWTATCGQRWSLILAGNVLFAGGDGEVAALSIENGKPLWSAKVDGAAYGLAVANGRLFVSTDHGTIHCFAQGSRDGGPGSGKSN